MYDSLAGRFLSEDPLGFAGLDSNLFRYVYNSPLTFTDPFGTAAAPEYTSLLTQGAVYVNIVSSIAVSVLCEFVTNTEIVLSVNEEVYSGTEAAFFYGALAGARTALESGLRSAEPARLILRNIARSTASNAAFELVGCFGLAAIS